MQFVQFPDADPGARHLVLVVDDQPEVRRLIARYLYRRGVSAVQAANGVEALHQLATGRYAAVVSDVQMPGGDGLTLWQRATEKIPALRGRFVFCSAVAGAVRDQVSGERFVTKPVDLAQLWSAVQEVLQSYPA